MSRYIDADALEYDTEWSEYHDGFTAYSQIAIDTAPSIDIVRCQDCKHWVYNFNGCARNPCTEPWYATDFCSYGERREP